MNGCDACFGEDAAAVWNARSTHTQFDRLVEESHFSISLSQCRRCAQYFVSVFCERIDFVNGNDPQDWLLIPITPEEAAALQREPESTVYRGLVSARRYLVRYYPSDAPAPMVKFVHAAVVLPPHD